MTTEIAIMNRQAIALAADSAVTVGRQRVWKNANKLFSLAPFNDIAIMANGSGDFVGFPWETIIKSYRLHIGNTVFKTVDDCAKNFMSYLSSGPFNNEDLENLSIYYIFVKTIETLKGSCNTYSSKKDFRSKLQDAVRKSLERAEKQKVTITDASFEEFKKIYNDCILQFCGESFQEHIPSAILLSIVSLCFELYRREIPSGVETGLAFAGFGTDEYFPSLIVYVVDGKQHSIIRSWYDDESSHNINEKEASDGVIVPFGQSDIAALFLDGIASSHIKWMKRYARVILRQKSEQIIKDYISDEDQRTVERELQRKINDMIISEFSKEFDKYKDKSLVQPIMSVVSSLPKEEMAIMAESLVELTALRRRVDSPLESVGGPIDVIIISKGDGLVWIKRKHYFDILYNGDFKERKNLQIRRSTHERKNEPQIDGEVGPELPSGAGLS